MNEIEMADNKLTGMMQQYYDKTFLRRVSKALCTPFGQLVTRIQRDGLKDNPLYSGKYAPRKAKIVGFWAKKAKRIGPGSVIEVNCPDDITVNPGRMITFSRQLATDGIKMTK